MNLSDVGSRTVRQPQLSYLLELCSDVTRDVKVSRPVLVSRRLETNFDGLGLGLGLEGCGLGLNDSGLGLKGHCWPHCMKCKHFLIKKA